MRIYFYHITIIVLTTFFFFLRRFEENSIKLRTVSRAPWVRNQHILFISFESIMIQSQQDSVGKIAPQNNLHVILICLRKEIVPKGIQKLQIPTLSFQTLQTYIQPSAFFFFLIIISWIFFLQSKKRTNVLIQENITNPEMKINNQ